MQVSAPIGSREAPGEAIGRQAGHSQGLGDALRTWDCANLRSAAQYADARSSDEATGAAVPADAA
jgi:hypothetical protein